MFKQRVLAVTAAASTLLAGCTTTSFAPPEVRAARQGAATADERCNVSTGPVSPDVAGATDLTDNFLAAYRCAARQAANGRKYFEVPSFLALVTAAAGPSYGMSKRAVLGSGIAAGLFGQANGYFAPKEKAAILDHAIDALLCVKTEAVGVDFFDAKSPAPAAMAAAAQSPEIAEVDSTLTLLAQDLQERVSDRARLAAGADRDALDDRIRRLVMLTSSLKQRRAELLLAVTQPNVNSIVIQRSGPSGTVSINVSRQYFETVSAALLQIERVLAQRLSNAGSPFDAAGISAEIERATKEAQAAQAKKDAMVETQTKQSLGLLANGAQAPSNDDLILVSVERLQPALQTCVTRAKM